MVDTLDKRTKNTVSVAFDLEIEVDGWPPISTEILQALPLSDFRVRIDNTPFFITSIALGDVIEIFKLDGEKYYRCKGLVEEGGNYALSIILRNHEHKESIVRLLSNAGCFYEYGEFGVTQMYAVSVSEETSFIEIKTCLNKLETEGIVSYAELCLP